MKNLSILIISLIANITTIQAQSWTQIGQDIDGEAEEDYFGYSVSLSSDGSIVAIGANRNDNNGTNSGHVRIYKNYSGSWSQIGQDINGEAANDNSGISVSLNSDGSMVAIGAYWNSGSEVAAGHVRIYENQSGTWIQVGQDIDGEAAYDESGISVSLSSDGSIVAIGARQNDGNGYESGHVRIYENQSGTWTQIGQDIDGEAAHDKSYLVSLNSDGSMIAYGGMHNDGNGNEAGHVRIYENQNGIWTQIGQDIDGEAANDYSGKVSLSSDGSVVAIGANRNDGNGNEAGHVRIYENQNGIWTQVGHDIDGEALNDSSGGMISLNFDGSIVAIGAPYNDGNGTDSGHVRIYKNQNGIWTQIGQDIDGEAANDYSGKVSLSSDGSTVAIGAPYNDGNGTDSGHVRVFSLDTNIGVETLQQSGISIIPNPTYGIVRFECKEIIIQKIIISDITGKQLVRIIDQKLNGQLDLSSFEKGIYLINIQTDKEVIIRRIIKQ